jgi:glyoxylase-like metal-dependent hydrolase (beta-lactamase superfamily II)
MANTELIATEVVRVPTGIANCYLVGSPQRWILIDSGTHGHASNIRGAAAEHFGEDARPEAIMLTHGHFDHAGSARELAKKWEVEIYAHRLEIPFVDGSSKYPPQDPTVGGFMSQMIRFFPNKKMDLSPFVRELKVGWLPWIEGWNVIETPGHTPGHVSFFRADDRTLIAGDAFTTVNQDSMSDMLSQRQQVSGPPPYYTCDWQSAERSVKRLAELNPRVLAAGHGIPMRGAQASTQLRALANNFPIPEHGRYVRESARSDASGVTYLPPPVHDPVKTTAMVTLGIAGTLAAGMYLRRKQRMPDRDFIEQAA